MTPLPEFGVVSVPQCGKRRAGLLRQFVRYHKTNIVPGIGVFGTNISQPYNQIFISHKTANLVISERQKKKHQSITDAFSILVLYPGKAYFFSLAASCSAWRNARDMITETMVSSPLLSTLAFSSWTSSTRTDLPTSSASRGTSMYCGRSFGSAFTRRLRSFCTNLPPIFTPGEVPVSLMGIFTATSFLSLSCRKSM